MKFNPYLLSSILATSILALVAVTSHSGSSSAANGPKPDLKFGKNTFMSVATSSECPAGTLPPCDTVILTAPFTCSDCRKDFASAFASSGGDEVTVGFVAPGGQCPTILSGGNTTGTTYSIDFSSLNVVVSALTNKETLYEGAAVFPDSGHNAFASAILDVKGN